MQSKKTEGQRKDKKEIDVKEHVDVFVDGDDYLSEEFKTKSGHV